MRIWFWEAGRLGSPRGMHEAGSGWGEVGWAGWNQRFTWRNASRQWWEKWAMPLLRTVVSFPSATWWGKNYGHCKDQEAEILRQAAKLVGNKCRSLGWWGWVAVGGGKIGHNLLQGTPTVSIKIVDSTSRCWSWRNTFICNQRGMKYGVRWTVQKLGCHSHVYYTGALQWIVAYL